MELLSNIPGASLLGYIIPFLVVLTIVVFFHELGHFLVARWNGVKVDAFSVGFGPELFGWFDKHGTRWKFCVIPLGGYVKFFGDANEASAPDHAQASAMTEEERSVSFIHKAVWQRAAVVAAGPLANFILAIVIFTGTFMIAGKPVTDPIIAQVREGSPAAAAGLQPGDLVVSIDGNAVNSFSDVPKAVQPNPGREMTFTIARDGREFTVNVTPALEEFEDRFGNVQKVGLIGISNDASEANFRVVKFGPVGAFVQGVNETWFIITHTLGYLKDIITGFQSADQLGGPIRIAKVSGDVATLGAGALLNLAAVLSVSIGLLNLFPIPMLDGGHLVFYLIEAIRGRPLSEYAQEIGFKVGLALVLMLMIFATWNDLSQLVFSSG